MSTRNFVPRANGEGGLGTSAKYWGDLYVCRVNIKDTSNPAAAHNGIYRGKDLTSYAESGEMSAAIADGSFKDIYIGDCITKTINLPAITYTDKAGASKTQAAQTFANVKWLVAALDPHLHCGYYEGDTVNYGETKEHHVLLIPASTLQRNVCMNPKVSNADTTAGGYIGSDMWRVHMPNWAAAIKSAFGASHVLRHYSIMSNSVDVNAPSAAGVNWKGSANNWAWTPVDVNIPNEAMVYGGSPASSSFEDTGDFPRILPLYALKCNHLEDRSWFWLRSVSSSAAFAIAYSYGNAGTTVASAANADGGIRPYFLYH